MREIKFRVWNIDDKEIVTMETHFADEEIECTNSNLAEFFEFYFGCELMQYTGLKDKNGVEIYEGDIVRYTYNKDTKNQTSFNEVIEWEETYQVSGFVIHKGMEYEVIGNIYENKDLL